MLTPAQWQAYKDVINSAHDSFNQDIVVWRRHSRGFQRYGEDNANNITFTEISLQCLVSYNIFRTWPMTDETPSGALDKESMTMILNKQYLSDAGYLNSDGFFAMDPGEDEFIHMGVKYRASGETPVAQAGDDILLFYIVLRREESNTGDTKY